MSDYHNEKILIIKHLQKWEKEKEELEKEPIKNDAKIKNIKARIEKWKISLSLY
jgi:hypothetical protein